MANSDSCDINSKNSCGCGSESVEKSIDFQSHWDAAYTNNPIEQLGWYETDLTPAIQLIEQSQLPKSARILNIGAGATTLIDELLSLGFSNLIATDISSVALEALAERVGEKNLEIIIDDLTEPSTLKNIGHVDLWIDRAVLHFFTEEKDRNTYFDLLKNTVKKGGFVIIAEFNLEGALKCSGLDVYRYSAEMIADNLGDEFEILESFDYVYTMPKGGLRPYVYTLFQRIR